MALDLVLFRAISSNELTRPSVRSFIQARARRWRSAIDRLSPNGLLGTRERQVIPNLCSCAAQPCGSARASVVTVRSAGALPLAMASTMRGDTKASGARYRMWRSTLFSLRAIASNELTRPSAEIVHPGARPGDGGQQHLARRRIEICLSRRLPGDALSSRRAGRRPGQLQRARAPANWHLRCPALPDEALPRSVMSICRERSTMRSTCRATRSRSLSSRSGDVWPGTTCRSMSST